MIEKCPWGKKCVNLKGVELSSSEKTWLGEQASKSRQSAIKLALKYNLGVSTIRKYCKIVLNGGKFLVANGRPQIINKDLKENMKQNYENLYYAKRTSEWKEDVQVSC